MKIISLLIGVAIAHIHVCTVTQTRTQTGHCSAIVINVLMFHNADLIIVTKKLLGGGNKKTTSKLICKRSGAWECQICAAGGGGLLQKSRAGPVSLDVIIIMRSRQVGI